MRLSVKVAVKIVHIIIITITDRHKARAIIPMCGRARIDVIT